MKLDLRIRCKRCRKIPRGKMQQANFERYDPFCSFHCAEWFRLEEAQRYLALRAQFTSTVKQE
jgi:hypothetical protein